MYIEKTYIGTLDGIEGIWCGFIPEGANIVEEREVLYADKGKILKRIATEETMYSIWLQNGDVEDNYIEVLDEGNTEYQELNLTRGDVFRGIYLAKGIKRNQIRNLIENMPEATEQEIELALIDFDEALHFYRALPLIDKLGEQLGISPNQMTAFFVTNDYHYLIGDNPAAV